MPHTQSIGSCACSDGGHGHTMSGWKMLRRRSTSLLSQARVSRSTISWISASTVLEDEPQRLLEVLADAGQELGGVGAVEDAVVARERQLHHAAHLHLAVADDRPGRQLAHGQ